MSSTAGRTRTRRRYEEPAPREPFESTQFLIEPARSPRRQIDNDHGDPVLLVVAAPARPTLRPRRTAAFYDIRTAERLIELRPEPGARAAHRLIDASGASLARIELDLAAGRWTCRDAEGRAVASATAHPRAAAIAALGRGRWVRTLVLTAGGRVAGVVVRRSPEFDDHDLVDLSHDTERVLDRRLALALAVLAG